MLQFYKVKSLFYKLKQWHKVYSSMKKLETKERKKIWSALILHYYIL